MNTLYNIAMNAISCITITFLRYRKHLDHAITRSFTELFIQRKKVKENYIVSLSKYFCILMVSFLTIQNFSIAMQTKYDSLIPRNILFGNPDKIGVKISHDGRYIGYIAPKDGVLNVYFADSNDINNTKCITNDRKRGIRSYFFAYDNKHIIYMQDDDGDENWSVFSVNMETLEEKRLTEKGVRAEILEVSHKYPTEILVKLNKRNPQWHDVYKLNIITGEISLIYENNEFIDIIADDDLKLRFAIQLNQEGMQYVYKIDDEFKKEELWTVSPDDMYTTAILGFNKENSKIYKTDSKNRNTAALFELDLDTKEQKLLYENGKSDVSSILVHPTGKNILLTQCNYLKNETIILDDSIRSDIQYLESIMKGELAILSMTTDFKTWIVADIQDDGPVVYYQYIMSNSEQHGEIKFLFKNRKDLDKYQLSKMHPIIIKSRDDLDLISYLTLPFGMQKGDEIKAIKPLPLILLVHGGPTARDQWGFDSMHQWLANRGYAVLSVNYRGSTGFGKEFINAGNGEWAGKMHDDLIDAVNWAIQNKIADKDRVAIMGGSYGGYAALVGVTFTPDVFACSVDIVGPSSIETLLNTIPPYWKPALTSLQIKVGADHTTEEGKRFLATRSPINYVDKIVKPLLIGQGANDPRVKQSESDQIVSAMKKRNIPVTYVLYSDEGHGFARPENRMSFFAITEGFLSNNLGGRFEDINCAFENSSLKIPHGKEFLPKMIQKCHTFTEDTGE